MQMPNRKFDAGSKYRYGFNGKEIDKETATTTTYDYGFRIYNPSLGKFLSVDPLTKSYPWYTPFQFAGNSPLKNIDLDGMEPQSVIDDIGQITIPVIGFIAGAIDVKESILRNTVWFIGNGNIHWEWRKPNAITVGNKIYYSQDEGNKNKESDVPHWVSLVVHEVSHRVDYEEQGFYGFLHKYFQDYNNNLKAGQSEFSAYYNIDSEKKAYANEKSIKGFFNNLENTNRFFDILNSQVYGQLEKSDRLKVLGIEKILIPKIEFKIKEITNRLNSIDSKKDFFGIAKFLTQIELNFYKNELNKKKNEAEQVNEKIEQGNYQSLPGDD